MGANSSQEVSESWYPCEYQDARDIPFAPDGNASILHGFVEDVKGTRGRFQGLECVRKTIVSHNTTDQVSEDNIKRKLIHEVQILHSARHQHVVRLFHSYFCRNRLGEIQLAVVMDRADVNLHGYLKPGNKPHKRWFGCLINAIHHIHALGIRHRDIKPSNVLVKGGNVLLADFGISQMGLGQTIPTTNLKRNSQRTKEYCAPEVEQGRTRGRSADIFSLGAVFLEMLIAHSDPCKSEEIDVILKRSSQTNSSYAKNIDHVHRWMNKDLHVVGCWHDVLILCRKMLDSDRNRRPTSAELDMRWPSLTSFDEAWTCRCARLEPLSGNHKLVDACRNGSTDEARRLLREGADPRAMSAIHFAAERGSKAIVQAILDGGVDVDSPNPVGQTALHCAVRNGCGDTVELLLERGANVNARDENDQTPLHAAAAQGHAAIVRMMLGANADIEAEDQDGDNAFQYAARRDHTVVLEILENHLQTSASMQGSELH